MNKIASILYLMEHNIPTSNFFIINPKNIERNIKETFYESTLGWVIRCGKKPNIKEKLEKGLPWAVCSSIDDVIQTVREVYKDLGKLQDYYVFIHPQREMEKSGNILVKADSILIESVKGWPEGLSHGTQNPDATYIFNAPSLFIKPFKAEGKKLLSYRDLWVIGNNIERKLNYKHLSLTNAVTVEFSINKYGKVSAHDINVN